MISEILNYDFSIGTYTGDFYFIFLIFIIIIIINVIICNFVIYPKDGDHPLDSLANLCTNYTWKEKLEHPYIFVASYFNHLLKSGFFLNIQWICNRKFPIFGWWKSQFFLLLLLDIMNIFPRI